MVIPKDAKTFDFFFFLIFSVKEGFFQTQYLYEKSVSLFLVNFL